MNRSMQKENKGKLRTGTANKATIGLGVFTFYFERSVFTFGLGFPALRFSRLRCIVKLSESLIEMKILIEHSFLHLFTLHRSKCGNCDITYVLSISVTSINNNNNL